MSSVHPRLAVSLVCAGRWPVSQSLEHISGLGVGAISMTMAQLAGQPEETIAQVRASGLDVITLAMAGPSLIESEEQTLAHLAPVIEAASALGSPGVFCVTGPTPPRMSSDEAFARFVQCVPAANHHARALGVRLGLEHGSQTTRSMGFIHTLADACALAAEADLGVVVELQNAWYECGLPKLFREHASRFLTVNVSDFMVGEELRLNRRVPGDGSMPLEWLIGELLDAGYPGYFDLEFLGPAIEAEGYASAIGRGVEWLSERLTKWGVS